MKKPLILLFLIFSFSASIQAVNDCVFTGGGDGTSWSDPDNWTCDCHCDEKIPEAGDNAFISGSTVLIDLGIEVKTINLMDGATLTSIGDLLAVNEGIIWAHGTIDAEVIVLSVASVAMVSEGAKVLSGSLALEVGVTATWDAGSFTIDPFANLILAGDPDFLPAELAITFDGSILGTDGLISNGGIIRKVGGAGTSMILSDLTNGGGIVVETGTLELVNGLTDNPGILDIFDGATLRILDRSLHQETAQLVGLGTLELKGPGPHDLTFDYDGFNPIIFEADTTIIDGDFITNVPAKFLRGAIVGNGLWAINDAVVWERGFLELPMTVNLTGFLNIFDVGAKHLKQTLLNRGLVVWNAGTLYVESLGDVDNHGTFRINPDNSRDIEFTPTEGAGTFTNRGTFAHTGEGLTEIKIPFSNTGLVHIIDGQLELEGEATFSEGELRIDEGQTFTTTGGTNFGPLSKISGIGRSEWMGDTSIIETDDVSSLEKWWVEGGRLFFNAAIHPEELDINLRSGRVEINESISPASLLLVTWGGIFKVTETISPAYFDLGMVSGIVELDLDLLPATSELSMAGGTLRGSTEGVLSKLNITDNFHWQDGRVELNITGDFDFNIDSPCTKDLSGKIDHSGTVNWTAGDINIETDGEWNNEGYFNADANANVTGDGDFNNDGIFDLANAGTLEFEPNFLNNGTISGCGGIRHDGTVGNLGIVSPGNSPGLITIFPNYTNGHKLAIEVENDAGPGIGHDQLIVDGTAWLADSLVVTEIGAAPDGEYVVLLCRGAGQCIQGAFSSVALPQGYTYHLTDSSVVVTKGILPVNWLSFSAQAADDIIQLDWATSTEQGNDYFIVERAIDDQTFIPIAEIDGTGNSLTRNSYLYLDTDLPNSSARITYRIKQVDFSGLSSYSPLDQINWVGKEHQLNIEQVYLPAPDLLQVNIRGINDRTAGQLQLIDANGRLIIDYYLAPGEEEIQLQLPAYSNFGTYFLRLSNGYQSVGKKIIINPNR